MDNKAKKSEEDILVEYFKANLRLIKATRDRIENPKTISKRKTYRNNFFIRMSDTIRNFETHHEDLAKKLSSYFTASNSSAKKDPLVVISNQMFLTEITNVTDFINDIADKNGLEAQKKAFDVSSVVMESLKEIVHSLGGPWKIIFDVTKELIDMIKNL